MKEKSLWNDSQPKIQAANFWLAIESQDSEGYFWTLAIKGVVTASISALFERDFNNPKSPTCGECSSFAFSNATHYLEADEVIWLASEADPSYTVVPTIRVLRESELCITHC